MKETNKNITALNVAGIFFSYNNASDENKISTKETAPTRVIASANAPPGPFSKVPLLKKLLR